jgi:hypothetical protein
MTKIINEIGDIRRDGLELDGDDEPMEYSGDASGILKLKFPINVTVASRLFAAISIDDSLPKKINAYGVTLSQHTRKAKRRYRYCPRCSLRTYESYQAFKRILDLVNFTFK